MLASVLPDYGKFPFDPTLEAARNDIGGQPDLANPEHAKRLRIWLNLGSSGRAADPTSYLGSTGALVDEVLARRAARKASDG
jgi:hypothetical protein